MDRQEQHDDVLSQIAGAIGLTRGQLEIELAQDALAELRERGGVNYMGARERRLQREREVWAAHETAT
jgi:hypothetical protein